MLNVLERRKRTIAATLVTLLEYDEFLCERCGSLYTPGRRAAMARDIAKAREEIAFLDKQLQGIENQKTG